MNNPIQSSISRRLPMTATATALLGLVAVASATQAAPGAAQSGTVSPLILAATDGMDGRDDNRDDRQEDRGDRDDNRQDCRQEEGAGADKRDCKQDGRSDDAGADGDKG